MFGKMQTECDQATERRWDLTPILVCPQTGPGKGEDCPGSPGCDRRTVGGIRAGRNLLGDLRLLLPREFPHR